MLQDIIHDMYIVMEVSERRVILTQNDIIIVSIMVSVIMEIQNWQNENLVHIDVMR